MKKDVKIKGLAGLASLASSVGGADADKEFDSLPLELIYSKAQPRTVFEDLENLAESLKGVGQLQPIVVSPDGKGQYIIEQGERRYRAAKIAGLTHLDAVISKPSGSKADRIMRQLAENAARDDMKLHEVVAAVGQILKLGVASGELARKIGKDKSYVSTINALTDLPPVLNGLMMNRLIQDPVSLRRLKKLHDVSPAQVEAQIDVWKSRAARNSSDETSDGGEPYVITRAQVTAFARSLERKKEQTESADEAEKSDSQTGSAEPAVLEVDPAQPPAAKQAEGESKVAPVQLPDDQDTVCKPENFRVFVEVGRDRQSGYIDASVIPAGGQVSVVLETGEVVRVNPSEIRLTKIGVFQS